MSTSQPVVSFAGPLIKADKAIDVAYDLFEKRQIAAGIEQLQIVQKSIDQVVEFFVAEEAKAQKK